MGRKKRAAKRAAIIDYLYDVCAAKRAAKKPRGSPKKFVRPLVCPRKAQLPDVVRDVIKKTRVLKRMKPSSKNNSHPVLEPATLERFNSLNSVRDVIPGSEERLIWNI